MKTLTSLAMAILLFFNCGSDVEFQTAEMPSDIADALTLDQTAEMQPPLTDVLTFELSFGAEDLPDEYLLAMRSSSLLIHYLVTVDNENNVYVFDESRLKVYEENGKAKAIIGGPGEGPGEFIPIPINQGLPTVGLNGYITVFNGVINTFYNVYNPQHKFVKSVNKKRRVTGQQYNCKVITINEDEYIGEVFENHPKDNLLIRTFSIEYSKNEEKIPIASYDIATDVIYREDHKSLPNTGDLFWDLLPGRKVIYTHTRQDEIYTSEGNFYIIHIYDIDSGERKVFKKRFTPVPLDDMIWPRGSSGGGVQVDKLREDYIKKINIKYGEALRFVFFDGPVMYAFTNTTIKRGKNSYECLVDVIDVENEKYIRSVYLPSYHTVLAIKNGYAYMRGKSNEGFPEIQKYKIDPVVYGK